MLKIENQLDKKWGSYYIGDVKSSSFRNYACFLFCLTYMYSINRGKQVDPAEVDKMFLDNGVYRGDLINSEKAAKVLGLQYFGIEKDIDKAPSWYPSIKQVDYSIAAGKQTHFVVRSVIGGKKCILDPLGGVARPINFYEKKVGEESWQRGGFSYRLFAL
jgi:hypothetical protein